MSVAETFIGATLKANINSSKVPTYHPTYIIDKRGDMAWRSASGR